MAFFNLLTTRQRRFKKVVCPHLDTLYSVALGLTGRRHDAEDLVQEACCAALHSLEQLRDDSRAKYWLLAILRNTFLRERDRSSRFPVTVDVGEYTERLEALVDHDHPAFLREKAGMTEVVRQALSRLPEKYKTVLLLYYGEEWNCREIGAALQLPVNTVLSRLARGRAMLKAALLRSDTREMFVPDNIVPIRSGMKR